ncbi:MAG: hypothetical protein ACTSPD_10485 [Promethearchaeota archaeon]
MAQYGISRNIESSTIDYLTTEINANWNRVIVEKTYSRAYNVNMDENAVICIRVGDTRHESVELGSKSTTREPFILIDIFGQNDGNRLDLKDFIVDKLKHSWDYYEYEIENGEVKNKVATNYKLIAKRPIIDKELNTGTDKSKLDIHDRYRHLITVTLILGKVEA